jgi:hypothetical protein
VSSGVCDTLQEQIKLLKYRGGKKVDSQRQWNAGQLIAGGFASVEIFFIFK